ncbi:MULTISPECIES: MATE family efflux transporter [unclassified Devosia]|uniref:MATE family efflux transporter n=1 Tax=unclassified Devosia TaxID=196773 RepID=UPI0008684A07|nr:MULTISPECIES: MATE family efflux transporter [unclassified Devosia]MBN9363742.1 MATE family efflux transporter [Devosia sp.]ODS95707.1 MAG: MATE family efflux transporter [Devosia sp. SCN 66-27]OJX27030.1 MAG: MATE family efflux transporter [Devosia sp. 66-14]
MTEPTTVPVTGTDASTFSNRWTTELRASFALAWPLIIAQLAQNLLFTTDVVLMGWLGPKYLAAGTLAGAFLVPFQLTGIGIVGAVAPLVAQARGRGDTKAVRRIVRQGFWVAILVATLLVPIVLNIRPIYLAIGQDPEVTALAESYMFAGFWMLYPALGIMVVRSFLSAFAATRIILVVTIIGVLVNAMLAYTLIFGHFGFPRLELRGAAIATGLVNLIMFLALLGYVVTHRKLKRFHILVRFFKPDWPRFREILKVGLPIGLTVAAEVGLFSVAAILMGRLGTNETAAHAVALQLASTAFMVPLGLGMAATVRVGLAYGRGDAEGVRLAGWTAIVMGTGFMALTAALFLAVPHALVTIFLDSSDPANATALMLAATYLGIAGIFQLVDGAQVVAAHSLRGLSDTRTPMLLAIFGYWFVGLPTAYVLGFVFDLRGVGVWLGLATGLAFVAVLLVSRFALRGRLGLMKTLAASV